MWVILSRPDCPWCDKAIDLLWDEGFSADTYDVTDKENKWILSLLKKCDIRTVPQIFTPKGEHIGGYHQLLEYMNNE